MNFYLVLRHDTPTNKSLARVTKHLSWMHTQHDRGTVLISGPSADGELGIYLLRAATHAQATALAAADPLAIDGVRVEIIDWTVHQILGIGSFTPPENASCTT